jgi:protein required for attachment to host cells
MDKIRIRAKDWILVCDGSKALLLRNDGDAQNLNLVEIRKTTNEGVPTHELGDDRPGRVYGAADGIRSAIEAPDLHEREERNFLAGVAQEMENEIARGAVQRLFLIAPPRALGLLRSHFNPASRDAIAGEIAKDFTKMPVYEIETRLQADNQ